jgi:SAM-dependent methyltransferase
VTGTTEWEEQAHNWVRWARTDGHDAYWSYRRSFFDVIVPPPGSVTVEIGCGEGRVQRDLRDRDHRTIGVDLSPTLLDSAHRADPTGRHVLADAAILPLADESCDLVVAYNSLMDIADMPGALSEVARILVPGGRLCVCITHPIENIGRFSGHDPDAEFTVTDPYFGVRRFEASVERDGLTMTFRGWSYPLEAYTRALEEAGLLIEMLREPLPEAPTPRLLQWRRMPMFLHLRALKSVNQWHRSPSPG